MKNVQEAVQIIESTLNQFIQQYRDDETQATSTATRRFFHHFVYRDPNELKGAQRFLKDFNQHDHFVSTPEILDFAKNYRFENTQIQKAVRQVILEVAGFNQKHIDYLANLWNEKLGPKLYSRKLGPSPKHPIHSYQDERPQDEAKLIINEAINGSYSSVVGLINNYLGLNEPHSNDYGQKLLNFMHRKFPETKPAASQEMETERKVSLSR